MNAHFKTEALERPQQHDGSDSEPKRLDAFDLDNAATEVGEIAEIAGLIAMAAESMIADGDTCDGPRFRATAWHIETKLRDVSQRMVQMVEAWLAMDRAAKDLVAVTKTFARPV